MENISYDTFVECIKRIVEISSSLDDGWQHRNDQSVECGQYLTKSVSQTLEDIGKGDEKIIDQSNDDENCEEKIEGAKMSNANKMIVLFEYHIAYNVNYGVPVLCFIAWKQDGSLLRLEEYCQYYNQEFNQHDISSTLTQLDHPVLCRPFLTLHPCRTHEIFAIVNTKSKNPIISWLSTLSPLLRIHLDNAYIRACI